MHIKAVNVNQDVPQSESSPQELNSFQGMLLDFIANLYRNI